MRCYVVLVVPILGLCSRDLFGAGGEREEAEDAARGIRGVLPPVSAKLTAGPPLAIEHVNVVR